MTAASLAITWSARPEPLPPVAVAAVGSAAVALRAATFARRLDGINLRAAASPEWIVVLGHVGDLPWVDGATYLGWDGGWLLPTALAPYPGVAFVQAALNGSSSTSLTVLLPGQLLRAALPVRAADPARPSPGRPIMTTALRLPNALAPWAEALEVLDAEVAIALGPIIARLDQLIDSARFWVLASEGELDGYAGISRRGGPERLLDVAVGVGRGRAR